MLFDWYAAHSKRDKSAIHRAERSTLFIKMGQMVNLKTRAPFIVKIVYGL